MKEALKQFLKEKIENLIEECDREVDEKNLQLKEKDSAAYEMQAIFKDLVQEYNHLKDENRALKRNLSLNWTPVHNRQSAQWANANLRNFYSSPNTQPFSESS